MVRFKWNSISLIVVALLFIVLIIFIDEFYRNKLIHFPIIEDLTPGPDYAYSIALDSEYFYVAGSCDNCGSLGSSAWQIEKRKLSDGQLDSHFGHNGVIISDPTSGYDEAQFVTISPSCIYIVGYQGGGGAKGGNAWRIEKRNKIDGTYDTNFGSHGYLISDPTKGDDYARSIDVDDSFIYITGNQDGGGDHGGWAWRIEKRNKIDGSYDKNFGLNGFIISDPSNGNGDESYSIFVDPSSIYIAGYQAGAINKSEGAWRIEKRNKIDGSYDTKFGLDGYIVNDPTSFLDEARSIFADSSYIYIAGYQSGGGNKGGWAWRIEKRNKIDGSYDSNFGSGGYVISDPTSYNDVARYIIGDSSSIYVGGHQNGDNKINGRAWRIEKRNKIDGSYDSNFGSGGYVISDPTKGDDFIYSISNSSSDIYIAGYQANGGDKGKDAWRIEKRNKVTGQ